MTRLFNSLRALLAIITGTTTCATFLLSGVMTLIIAIGNSSHPSGMGPDDVGFLERLVIFVPFCGGVALTIFLGFITHLLWPWKEVFEEEEAVST